MYKEINFMSLTIPDFPHKTKLDEYLISAVNFNLYQLLRKRDLTEEQRLDYFNRIYFLYNLVISNLDKPSSVVNFIFEHYWGEEPYIQYDLLEDLLAILKKSKEFKNDKYYTQLYKILDLIQDEACKLQGEIMPEKYGDGVEREFKRIVSYTNTKRDSRKEIKRVSLILSKLLQTASTTKDQFYEKLATRLSEHIKYMESLLLQNEIVNERIPALTVNTNQSNKNDQPVVYIFPKELLNKFHSAFNGELWEDVGSEECLEWFREDPVGMPIFKFEMKRYFCYAIGKIEDKLIPESRPANFGKWMKHHIGNSNYSSLKNYPKLIQEKLTAIDKKIASF